MTTLSKILLTYDIAYVIIFFYGTNICNKYYDGDVDKFFELAPKAFINTIVFGMFIVFLQLIYFTVSLIWRGHI